MQGVHFATHLLDGHNMNKLIKEALKDIARIEKELPELKQNTIKYWIRHAYMQGQINILEMVNKRNEK